ncbi:hypothetical protein XENOCAPTIV_000589 [Xenoophorus captivus]|uniref:Uncharacterized protein n=1 Tax=Xenoophorus captivus TaxID=1517983 RepID=A0ABV0QZ70_9TELE
MVDLFGQRHNNGGLQAGRDHGKLQRLKMLKKTPASWSAHDSVQPDTISGTAADVDLSHDGTHLVQLQDERLVPHLQLRWLFSPSGAWSVKRAKKLLEVPRRAGS